MGMTSSRNVNARPERGGWTGWDGRVLSPKRVMRMRASSFGACDDEEKEDGPGS